MKQDNNALLADDTPSGQPPWSPMALLLKQGREFGMAVALGLKTGEASRCVQSNAAFAFVFANKPRPSRRRAKRHRRPDLPK